jgi:osmoprotectant transport system permease protein
MTRNERSFRLSRAGRAVLSTIAVFLLFFFFPPHAAAKDVKVGSKRFTESYVLAEIVVALAKTEGITLAHEQGLGGTAVTFRAIEDGAIDLYPEYTGTLAETVVKDGGSAELARLRAALAPRGIAISEPLGFSNRYALATSRNLAARLKLAKTSDLGAHPELRIGLSHEFAGRTDGWPGLAAKYGFPVSGPSTLDHALAYEALVRGTIDVTDVYTTDAKIARYDLFVLDDDKDFFPPYEAVLVYRKDVIERAPALARVFDRMKGSIDEKAMQKLNARAELDGIAFANVAEEHVSGKKTLVGRASFASGLLDSILRHGPRHLALVLGSLLLSALFGVPLGVLAYTQRRVGALVLGITGVVQTIPSLALFCFFIPLLGIGPVPALAALFLYGLLPIVRNTHAGLASIPGNLREAAVALGLSPSERLRHVELPLASRTILAGIKTSAVVAVGSATIAAFIGAGGFGEPISTGLSLNDVPTILNGAIPAAGLALVVQGAFALLERALVPRGLRDARAW